jgi:hypothetical protein
LRRGQRTGCPPQRVFEPPFSLDFLSGTESFIFQWELLCPLALVRRFCQCPLEWRRAVRWTSLLGTGQSKAVFGGSS